jgi:hypothetical protein|tara:strand:+ start:1216 stop:1416 length:201 start_codon:yes stop_codon:yes gene_type:complete
MQTGGNKKMTHKMQITLNARGVNALDELAEAELRDIRQQARQSVREGLRKKGKLEANDAETEDRDE